MTARSASPTRATLSSRLSAHLIVPFHWSNPGTRTAGAGAPDVARRTDGSEPWPGRSPGYSSAHQACRSPKHMTGCHSGSV
jgi:hypothetical protein